MGLVGSREEIFRFSRAFFEEKPCVSIGKCSTHGGFSWIFHIELLVYSRVPQRCRRSKKTCFSNVLYRKLMEKDEHG